LLKLEVQKYLQNFPYPVFIKGPIVHTAVNGPTPHHGHMVPHNHTLLTLKVGDTFNYHNCTA